MLHTVGGSLLPMAPTFREALYSLHIDNTTANREVLGIEGWQETSHTPRGYKYQQSCG